MSVSRVTYGSVIYGSDLWRKMKAVEDYCLVRSISYNETAAEDLTFLKTGSCLESRWPSVSGRAMKMTMRR